MLRRRVDRASESVELDAVHQPGGGARHAKVAGARGSEPDLLDYIVAIVTATRKDPQVQVGASPRGGLALVQLARGQAVLKQRDYVVPDDIKQVAPAILAHRIILKPESRLRKVTAKGVVEELLDMVAVPTSGARVMA